MSASGSKPRHKSNVSVFARPAMLAAALLIGGCSSGPASTASSDWSPTVEWSLSDQPTRVAGFSVMGAERGGIEAQMSPSGRIRQPSGDPAEPEPLGWQYGTTSSPPTTPYLEDPSDTYASASGNASGEQRSSDARWRSEILPERIYEYRGGRDPRTGLASTQL